MAMPKYAKLQNLLITRSKRSKERATFFNSPLGLWTLSALFLTLGSSVISARHECVATAMSDIQSFQKLATEIYNRRQRLLGAVFSSSNPIDFLRTARSNAYATFKEYDGQSLAALIDQQDRMLPKIRNFNDYRKHAKDLKKALEDRYQAHGLDDWMRAEPPSESEVDYEALERYRNKAKLTDLVYDDIFASQTRSSLRPNCSPWNLASQLIGLDETIIIQTSTFHRGMP
jgi:hypothetical protein